MFNEVTTFLIKSLSPIHAGSGRELGLVDMPIQRESHTGIPKIEGSSVKGSIRNWAFHNNFDTDGLFGKDTEGNGTDSAGLIGFSDAKLLFYPIKSLNNIFSYVTCPYLLERFKKDLELSSFAKKTAIIEAVSQLIDHNLMSDKAIIVDGEQEVFLDEYLFTSDKIIKKDTFWKKFKSNFLLQPNRLIVVLCNQDFFDLISLNREIITRNKINASTGIVDERKLFTEEYLPAESVLYTLLLKNGIKAGSDQYDEFLNKLLCKSEYLQIGGNANIGKGIVELTVLREGEEKNEQSEK